MKKTLFALLVASLLIIAGCSKDNVNLVEVSLTVNLPGDEPIEQPQTMATAGDPAVGFDVTFINTATQAETKVQTDAQGVAKAEVEEGVYNVSVYGTVEKNGKETIYQYNLNNQSIVAPVEGSGATGVTLPAIIPELAQVSGGWVIKEVYTSGTRTQAGKAYWGDQYIALYNNSNQVLYADSLVIGMSSKFTNDNTDQEYLSQYLPDKVVPDLLFQIPGSGKDHPVQPGECFILANQGLDHTKLANSKADMSKADFEWVDEGTSLDVDVPEVPNAVTVYGYSLTINIFSVQSNRAYFIFRPTEKNWIEQLKTTIVYPSGMSEEMYPVPSKDIIDGVQLCPKGSVLNSPSLPSSVDTGYSYVGENEGDSGSYLGLCVSRKIKEKTADGRYILQDTNNSSNDFLPNQEPSPYEVKE